MAHQPGDVMIAFRLSGEDATDFKRMAKDAEATRGVESLSLFAKSILLHVIADDRAAHKSA